MPYVIVYNDTNGPVEVRSLTIYGREEADALCETMNAAMKRDYKNFYVWKLRPAGLNANVARAIAEVSEFVQEYERWEFENSNDGKRTHIVTTGEWGTPVRLSLYTDQLRLLLAGLEAQVPDYTPEEI